MADADIMLPSYMISLCEGETIIYDAEACGLFYSAIVKAPYSSGSPGVRVKNTDTRTHNKFTDVDSIGVIYKVPVDVLANKQTTGAELKKIVEEQGDIFDVTGVLMGVHNVSMSQVEIDAPNIIGCYHPGFHDIIVESECLDPELFK
jgi:hypothetical protein